MPDAADEISPPKLISALRGFDLLPAIVFLPTRRKCDEAATEVALDRSQKLSPENIEKRREIFDRFVVDNPEIAKHKHRSVIVNAGVASHHAGHIPAWKLLIEKMMSAGLLRAIFATSTVAAGVDFPARTVVISNADTRGNDGWRPLRASELQQMTGRAGRRGKDNVGFVVLAPGRFQNPRKIAELLTAPPEPLESQFRSTYTSLLNLLDAFRGFSPLREIAEKSFAFRTTRHRIEQLAAERDGYVDSIRSSLGSTGEAVGLDEILGLERLTAARNSLHARVPSSRAEMRTKWLTENVRAGRIVTKGRSGKRFYMVLNVSGDTVSAMSDDGGGTKFPLSHVNRVFAREYALRSDDIEAAFYDIIEGKNEPLTEPRLNSRGSETDAADAVLGSAIDRLVPAELDEARRKEAFRLLWEHQKAAAAIHQIWRDIDHLRDEIWTPFERRARILDHFGYLEFDAELVTDRGKWLADLRVDRPLLVGEALRNGVFDGLDVPLASGLMASLAADSDRNYGDLYLSQRLLDAIGSLEGIIGQVSTVEWKNGIEPAPDINLSAAAAAERWARGMDWTELVQRTSAEEGDLVRLMSRTGEALLQIAHLKEGASGVKELAGSAAETMLREPVRP
jgi:superfamily II RNA helicase